MAGEGQTAAMVNAVENGTWLKALVGTFILADPGGYELKKLDDSCWAQRAVNSVPQLHWIGVDLVTS